MVILYKKKLEVYLESIHGGECCGNQYNIYYILYMMCIHTHICIQYIIYYYITYIGTYTPSEGQEGGFLFFFFFGQN